METWAETEVKTSPYTASFGDVVRVDADTTITLPPTSGRSGREVIVECASATPRTITVQGSGGQQIDGASSVTILTAFGGRRFRVRGFAWKIVASYRAAGAGAYVQTFAEVTRTLGAYVAITTDVAYTGQNNLQLDSSYGKVADIDALRLARNNDRALLENAARLLNQVVDDLQAQGVLL